MKVMIFVVDNLYKENTKNVEDFIENKDLAELYKKWIDIVEWSTSQSLDIGARVVEGESITADVEHQPYKNDLLIAIVDH